MRIYTTDRGIGRESERGRLDLLDLPQAELGELLRGPGVGAAREAAVTETVALHDVEILAPVTRPGKIVIIGYTFPSHGDEVRERLGDVHLPEEPNFRLVAGTAVTAPHAAIRLPALADTRVDYEGEVAAVIGRVAKDVEVGHGWEHVAGLTVVNDVTARDIQARAMAGDPTASLGIAKSFDTFKPLGPCLVTTDEIGTSPDLRLVTRVNGEVRQDDRTGSLLHPIPALVSYLSSFMTLEPGDVVCTGTPRGIGYFAGRFLQDGDEVEVEVEGIGSVRNTVRRS